MANTSKLAICHCRCQCNEACLPRGVTIQLECEHCKPEELGETCANRCCDNGNFGENHECQKMPPKEQENSITPNSRELKSLEQAILEDPRLEEFLKDRSLHYRGLPCFHDHLAEVALRRIIARLIRAAKEEGYSKGFEDGYEEGQEEEREKMKKDIAAMCGIPDAGDACRAILEYLNQTS